MLAKMLPMIFDKRLYVYLFFGFIIAVVAGTLSHECGHWLAARYFGFREAHINYAFTVYGKGDDRWLRMDTIRNQYAYEIDHNLNFPLKKEFDKLKKRHSIAGFLMTAGGPLQTMLTGTTGLILLFIFRRKFKNKNQLSFGQWLLVFLSLFWLRELFNLISAIIHLLTGKLRMHGDEFRLARILNWNPWSVYIVTGIISLLILWVIVVKFIPLKQRFTFIIAGFTGGLAVAYLWLMLLGPKLMP